MKKLFNYFKNIDLDIKVTFSLVLTTIGSGTVFYMFFEKWSLIDSLYFCVVTMATVGYGDVTPQTDVGKLFTIFYIFISIGTFVALCTQLANHQIQRKKRKVMHEHPSDVSKRN